MTTTDLLAERSQLVEVVRSAPPGQSAELERVAYRRAQAHDATDAARRRLEAERRGTRGGSPGADEATLADPAIEAHARHRLRELSARHRELEEGATTQTAWATAHAQDLARYAAIGEELVHRRRGAARGAVIEKPAHLVAELGPYPERRSQRGTWGRAATRIEKYRQDSGLEDPQNALGPEPREHRQRSAWRDARRDVDRARRELARPREATRDLERPVQ